MSKEEIKLSIYEAYDKGEISMEEKDALLVTLESSIMEGTNWDIHKKYKERIQATKESIRAIKKYAKAKEYDKAREEIKEAKLNLKETVQDLEKIESDVWHSILGYFMINVRVLVKSFLLALIPISTPIAGVYVLFKEFERTFKNYKKNGKITADDLNVYKNMCISEMQAMITTLENIEKKIDADEKLEEEQEEVKESLDAYVIDDVAFAFLEGAIDLDDANDLIEMMEAHSEPSRSQLNVEFQKNEGEIKALEEKLAELKKSSTLKDALKARLAKRQILDAEKQLKKVKDRNSEITKMIKDKDHKFGNWNRQMMHNYNQWHQQEIQRQMHQDMITQQHIQAHNDMVQQHNMMHQQAVQNHMMISTPGMGFGF